MSYIGKITAGGSTYKVGSTLYGTCDTPADTAAKVAVVEGFDTLETGVTVHIQFTASNTASNPTLAIKPSSSGTATTAKYIWIATSTSPGTTAQTSWFSGAVVSLTYDGTGWVMNDYVYNTDTNDAVTQTATTTDADYEVVFSGTADNETRTEGVGKSQYFKYNPSKRAFTFGTRASGSTVGRWSVAMGQNVTASNDFAYAEGFRTTASAYICHAEGVKTTASGGSSHAEGAGTTASGSESHAEGYGTTANHMCQHVFGQNNIADPSTATADKRGNYIEIVGNGQYDTHSNARTLDWDGNEWLAGGLTIGNPDTAEYTGLKYDGSRGALTIVGGQQYSGAEFYEPILTVKNNSQTMGTASINITPENIYFQGDTWDGTNTSLKDAISSLNSRIGLNKIIPGVSLISYTGSNVYTFPSDGYVYLRAKWGNSYIQADIYGSAGTSEAGFKIGATSNSTANGYYGLFVRKGMKLSNVTYGGSASDHEAYFFQLSN